MDNTKRAFEILRSSPMVKEALVDVLDFYQAKAINTMATAQEQLVMGQGQGMYLLVQMLKDRIK